MRISSHNLYHTIFALVVSHCTPTDVTTDTLTNISSIHSGVHNIVGWVSGKAKIQGTFSRGRQKKDSCISDQGSNTSTIKLIYTLIKVVLRINKKNFHTLRGLYEYKYIE